MTRYYDAERFKEIFERRYSPLTTGGLGMSTFKVIRAERLKNTKNGNPRYSVTLQTKTGQIIVAETQPDSDYASDIPNNMGFLYNVRLKPDRRKKCGNLLVSFTIQPT